MNNNFELSVAWRAYYQISEFKHCIIMYFIVQICCIYCYFDHLLWAKIIITLKLTIIFLKRENVILIIDIITKN